MRRSHRVLLGETALAQLTRGERMFAYSYTALGVLLIPTAVLMTVLGHGSTRTLGLILLLLAVVHMAVPITPFLRARVRRRERSGQ